jgi:hypothetical protein
MDACQAIARIHASVSGHAGWTQTKLRTEEHNVSVGNGLKIRFWENTWLGDTPSAKQYLSLYNIVQRKNV